MDFLLLIRCRARLKTNLLLGCYDNLVSGGYQSDIEAFLSSPRSLVEFTPEIEKLRSLISEISGLDDVVFFQMVQLDCSDVKSGLLRRAEDLLTLLVQQLATDHVTDSQR